MNIQVEKDYGGQISLHDACQLERLARSDRDSKRCSCAAIAQTRTTARVGPPKAGAAQHAGDAHDHGDGDPELVVHAAAS
ncbi:hypothetical protein D3C83_113290 [compost metagenome]